MTIKEEQAVNKLLQALTQIKKENEEFKVQIKSLVEKLDEKVSKKHLPINLENEITSKIKDSIGSAIIQALSGYNSPLKSLAESVILSYSEDIKKVFDQIIKDEISKSEFEEAIKDEFKKKLAKSIISGVEGTVDKEFERLKQNPVFRSELTILINNLVQKYNN